MFRIMNKILFKKNPTQLLAMKWLFLFLQLAVSFSCCKRLPPDNSDSEENAPIEFEESIYGDGGPGENNTYWLFTRHTKGGVNIRYGKSIKLSKYDPSRPLNVIVHGWKSHGTCKGCTLVRKAFLNDSDCNVLVVNWSSDAEKEYRWVAMALPHVARRLYMFIKWIFDEVGGNPDKLHLVGYGVGAHLVGYTGSLLHTANKFAARITALDPAGKLFYNISKGLKGRHARYVEVIHTDVLGAGTMIPLGHADFYPNGGHHQTGCKGKEKDGCSHKRAYDYFAASIQYKKLLQGKKCANLLQAKVNKCRGAKQPMGTSILNKKIKGIYALETSGKWPYCALNEKKSKGMTKYDDGQKTKSWSFKNKI